MLFEQYIVSDVEAVGLLWSVKVCGGPSLPLSFGRIDANVANTVPLPLPSQPADSVQNRANTVPNENQNITIHQAQFKRMGFTNAEVLYINIISI